MNGRRLIYVFFFFAVAITVVAPQAEQISADVSFKDTQVKLTCPLDDNTPEGLEKTVGWHKDGGANLHTGKIYSIDDYTDTNDGLYYCSVDSKTHYVYIKAKVCNGCVELDTLVAFAAIFADVLFTLGIVAMVYHCAKKKSGTAAAPQRAAQARQPRGQQRGPPVPDPDYQALNQATRANDVYAQANRR